MARECRCGHRKRLSVQELIRNFPKPLRSKRLPDKLNALIMSLNASLILGYLMFVAVTKFNRFKKCLEWNVMDVVFPLNIKIFDKENAPHAEKKCVRRLVIHSQHSNQEVKLVGKTLTKYC